MVTAGLGMCRNRNFRFLPELHQVSSSGPSRTPLGLQHAGREDGEVLPGRQRIIEYRCTSRALGFRQHHVLGHVRSVRYFPPMTSGPANQRYHVLGHVRSASTVTQAQLHPDAASCTASHRHKYGQPEHRSSRLRVQSLPQQPHNASPSLAIDESDQAELAHRYDATGSAVANNRADVPPSTRPDNVCTDEENGNRTHDKAAPAPTRCRWTRHPLFHRPPPRTSRWTIPRRVFLTRHLHAISRAWRPRRSQPPLGPRRSEPEQATEPPV